MDDEMTAKEFTAFISGATLKFFVKWRDGSALDPETYPPSMTKRQWVSEFNANYLLPD